MFGRLIETAKNVVETLQEGREKQSLGPEQKALLTEIEGLVSAAPMGDWENRPMLRTEDASCPRYIAKYNDMEIRIYKDRDDSGKDFGFLYVSQQGQTLLQMSSSVTALNLFHQLEHREVLSQNSLS